MLKIYEITVCQVVDLAAFVSDAMAYHPIRIISFDRHRHQQLPHIYGLNDGVQSQLKTTTGRAMPTVSGSRHKGPHGQLAQVSPVLTLCTICG